LDSATPVEDNATLYFTLEKKYVSFSPLLKAVAEKVDAVATKTGRGVKIFMALLSLSLSLSLSL